MNAVQVFKDMTKAWRGALEGPSPTTISRVIPRRFCKSHAYTLFTLQRLQGELSFIFTMSEASANLSSYDGSCHCGRVSFTAKLPSPIEEQIVNTCNCTDFPRGDRQKRIKATVQR